MAQAYNPRTGTYAATRQGSNVYGSWGSTAVQRGDDWAQTSRYTNRQTGATTRTVRTDDGAAVARGGAGGATVGVGQSGDLYAGNDGNVYRREDGTWQQHDGSGNWSNTDRQPSTANQLNRDSAARQEGAQRTGDYGAYRGGSGTQATGSYRASGGGGARRGGGGRRR